MNPELTLESLRREVARALAACVEKSFETVPERIVLERPPKVSLGDLASPVSFDLAKSLRRAPRAIAEEIARAVSLPQGVARAKVEGGGYVNFFFDRGAFAQGRRDARADHLDGPHELDVGQGGHVHLKRDA